MFAIIGFKMPQPNCVWLGHFVIFFGTNAGIKTLSKYDVLIHIMTVAAKVQGSVSLISSITFIAPFPPRYEIINLVNVSLRLEFAAFNCA